MTPRRSGRVSWHLAAWRGLAAIAGFVLATGLSSSAPAAAPRVLPQGRLPADKRLEPLKDLDGYFPFQVPATRDAWEQRAAQVRLQLQVALGIWPMPTRAPLKPTIHGRIDPPGAGYSVEKVYFESLPGFFVTGNLYRPVKLEGRVPGILCPHGHWSQGRFLDSGLDAVRREISAGAEKFEEGGRSVLQARCVQLARMGCIVFHYDMIGYADSTQISLAIAHGFAQQRPEMNAAKNWGLFSPQAEEHLQSVMGLQAIDSICALDFLTSLPEVDPQRIGVTGASGGGTQTFILCAIDPRPAVAFPAVMVSTAMQGGCTCENACGLRLGTGNVEIAGLFAPKPLAMTAANDWTKEMPTKGFPELQQLYRLLGHEDRVQLTPLLQFGHNYNYPSRKAMYGWFNRYLKLGQPEPIEEQDFPRQTAEQLTVWDSAHPQPPGGPEFERQLLAAWADDTDRQLDALRPHDAPSLAAYRHTVAPGIAAVLGRALPPSSDIEFAPVDQVDEGSWLRITGLVRYKPAGEELPVVFLHPKTWNGDVAIWIHQSGKNGLFDESGQPLAGPKSLLAKGVSVVAPDLIYQGEFLADGRPLKQTRRVKNPREAAAYTFGYNPTVFAQRVHDVLTLVALVRGHDPAPRALNLVGFGGAGPIVAAARALAGTAVDRAAVETGGFRFAHVNALNDPQFLPGGAKYDDLPGMLAISAPGRLWIAGEGTSLPEVVQAAYQAAGSPRAVTQYVGDPAGIESAALDWLTAR